MLYEAGREIALEMWPLLEEHIARAAYYHPFLDSAGLQDLVRAGLITIFVELGEAHAVMGFAAVEVLQYPRQRVANIVFAAGRRGFLEVLSGEFLVMLEPWARARGASAISLTGRPGWQRVARRVGFTAQRQALVYKELAQ